jgi:class 3 adenylate cyclase
MSGERVERRLAAIFAADVAGYSRLMGRDEAGTLARLRTRRREFIDPKIVDHRGRIVKTTGDGMLVEFPSLVEVVTCAVGFPRGMAERNSAAPSVSSAPEAGAMSEDLAAPPLSIVVLPFANLSNDPASSISPTASPRI